MPAVRLYIAVLVFVMGGLFTRQGSASEPSAEAIAFFEKKVRPVLVEHCQDCHSGDSPESGLQVDSLAGLLTGGLRGPAVAPGKPEESLLVHALRHDASIQMPPKSKLPTAVIADLAQWIAMGAPWPNAPPVKSADRRATVDEPELTTEDRAFWAFQPPQKPSLPAVTALEWVQTPIDFFVLARLEGAGLSPAPRADRRTLLRRATFDLTGLPPTPEELQAFLVDESPDAFAKVVDRLLASPQYGERWGRHWLDVARYSDSNGLDENLAFANAFRYRDYVVDAFNRNLPFDQFVRQQIAGDLLPDPGNDQLRNEQLVATGFLCLGAKMLAEDDPVKLHMDIIDEQVDTLGRTFMGMTLGCARCHDHKFDPISTADYYALAGIFKSTKTMDTLTVVARWQERPLASAQALEKRAALQAQINQLRDKAEQLSRATTNELLAAAQRCAGDYLLAATGKIQERDALQSIKPRGDQSPSAAFPMILIEAENYVRGNVLKDVANYGSGIGVLVNRGETPNFTEYDVSVPQDGVYQIEVRYAAEAARPCRLYVNGELLRANVADGVTGTWYPDSQRWEVETLAFFPQGDHVLRLEQPQFFPHIDKLCMALAPEPWQSRKAQFTSRAPLIVEFVDQWAAYLETTPGEGNPLVSRWRQAVAADDPAVLRQLADELQKLANQDDAAREGDSWRDLVYATEGPFAAPKTLEHYFPKDVVNSLAETRSREQQLVATLPNFDEAMAVSDGDAEDLAIHYRGSHLTLGPVVSRRFPRIFGDRLPAIAAESGSGRLSLADWLTHPHHPLTARVFVNRVWQWRFGEGLVRSPDNFGHLGESPTHPELLDWLAVWFVESGWNVKDLHRMMLLSSTWQQSTAENSQAAALDPENRLWRRMNRRRLEVEAIRDAILAVPGNLDRTMRGSLLPTPNRQYVTSTANVDPVVYATQRRSIYLPVVRSALYDVFQVFDFAEPSVLSGQRQTTTVAPQALFMMNSSFVAEQTSSLARRLIADNALDDAGRLRQLWLCAYAREPRSDELQTSLRFLQSYAEDWKTARPADAAQATERAWQSLCRAVIAANEFIYVE
jgi:hypothetical protein